MSEINALLEKIVAASAPYIIEARRYLHSVPEFGFEEVKTSTYVYDELVKMGYEPRKDIAKTGITADLKFANPGPCVLIRADMDGLPVEEATGLPFASTHPGKMHACGHDGHTAMLLGAARAMRELAGSPLGGELCGAVRFLFQPAEETPGGALPMIKEGVLEGVDFCLASHIWPQVPEGAVGVRKGPLMAGTSTFDITLHGRGGHSSQPHLCTDVLGAAAELALALTRNLPKRVDPMLSAVFAVCRLEAGNSYNVIPETARLAGGSRAFHRHVNELWEAEVETTAAGICAAYGIEYNYHKVEGHGPVDNDPEIAALVAEAAREVVGPDRVVEPEPSFAGEDFAWFQEHVPGCMFWLGCGVPDVKPLHSPQFCFNEDILVIGCRVFCQAALKIINKKRA